MTGLIQLQLAGLQAATCSSDSHFTIILQNDLDGLSCESKYSINSFHSEMQRLRTVQLFLTGGRKLAVGH
jgi:hypothetical protein